MKKSFIILATFLVAATHLQAQMKSAAPGWKTWFISSGKAYRLPPPSSYHQEVAQVVQLQKNLDAEGWQQILYWNAGAPGYRWMDLMSKIWITDTGRNGALAYMLLGTAIYDATISAWDTKYAYKRPRPFEADARIKIYGPKPESPSYPCEYSVAAGVAVTIFSHFYPSLSDSVHNMAKRLMASRIAAGYAFPSDTRAGFDLGKLIAEKEIAYTKDFVPAIVWDGKIPEGPQTWKGKPMVPLAGRNKTVVLESSSQYRPGPPPDYARDMEELKNFKQSFRSMSNAFYWASQDFWFDVLNKKIFEYNLQLDPPAAARIYAITAIATYDAFAACWDAKYTYWGTRPNQYDTSFKPALMVTPPFPGYPSGHAAISGVLSELYSYFFPAEASYFQQKAKQAAESRFQAGIHFRTDNEVGLELGRKVGQAVIKKVKQDGAELNMMPDKRKNSARKMNDGKTAASSE